MPKELRFVLDSQLHKEETLSQASIFTNFAPPQFNIPVPTIKSSSSETSHAIHYKTNITTTQKANMSSKDKKNNNFRKTRTKQPSVEKTNSKQSKHFCLRKVNRSKTQQAARG